MKERPILFSAPMVGAILEGRKTQTRRVVKNLDDRAARSWQRHIGPEGAQSWSSDSGWMGACPYGQPGDRLWVKETHSIGPGPDVPLLPGETGGALAFPHVTYAADGVVKSFNLRWQGAFGRKRPSIHMPRWASRITLELTDVHVQRLQDISADDAIAEGVEPALGVLGDDDLSVPQIMSAHDMRNLDKPMMPAPIARFVLLWDSINGGRPGVVNWNANPWVWVVSFQRVPA